MLGYFENVLMKNPFENLGSDTIICHGPKFRHVTRQPNHNINPRFKEKHLLQKAGQHHNLTKPN